MSEGAGVTCDNCGLPIEDDPVDAYHCDDCDKSVHADCMDWATVGNWDAETGNHFTCPEEED